MELFSSNNNYKLYHGSMLDMLEILRVGEVSSIVTDPPYELNFMGKGWDNSGIAFQKDTWEKCLKVLKPGGYLLAFGGSRTYHRIACAIEDAGFEIRDCIMWLYGSGFPKSLNIGLAIDKKNGIESEVVGKRTAATKIRLSNIGSAGFKDEWEEKRATNERAGWGTALKPSYEPIIVARKPLEGSCTDNVMKYGVGGINIDECRVGTEELHNQYAGNKNSGFTSGDNRDSKGKGMFSGEKQGETVVNGRFPANTILTYGDDDKEEVCSGFPNSKSTGGEGKKYGDGKSFGSVKGIYHHFYDEGSAARYFYCAKASKRDRDEGLQEFETKTKVFNGQSDKPSTEMKDVEKRFTTQGKNTHPTVKPTDLMQYLVRLVTPNGGTVLDPFNGSGSTGKAVMYENKDRNKNYKYIGIELTDEYLPIAKARIEYAINAVEEQKEDNQKSLFDIT